MSKGRVTYRGNDPHGSTTSQLIRVRWENRSLRASQPTSIEDERVEARIREGINEDTRTLPYAPLLSINNFEIVLNATVLIRTGCAEDT